MEISTECLPYEEDVAKDPFRLSAWLRYLSARDTAPLGKRELIYERALRAPTSCGTRT
jgi:pre-mRNA-splicing factor SYF1